MFLKKLSQKSLIFKNVPPNFSILIVQFFGTCSFLRQPLFYNCLFNIYFKLSLLINAFYFLLYQNQQNSTGRQKAGQSENIYYRFFYFTMQSLLVLLPHSHRSFFVDLWNYRLFGLLFLEFPILLRLECHRRCRHSEWKHCVF